VKHLTAICTGTPDGYRIRVLDEDHGVYLVHLFFDWDSFRPASAGHRLIEHGYMIRPPNPGRGERLECGPGPTRNLVRASHADERGCTSDAPDGQ
jgi:hypothetical protein